MYKISCGEAVDRVPIPRNRRSGLNWFVHRPPYSCDNRSRPYYWLLPPFYCLISFEIGRLPLKYLQKFFFRFQIRTDEEKTAPWIDWNRTDMLIPFGNLWVREKRRHDYQWTFGDLSNDWLDPSTTFDYCWTRTNDLRFFLYVCNTGWMRGETDAERKEERMKGTRKETRNEIKKRRK